MTNAELAILSLVVEQPRHGYEIEQVIEARGMRDWTEVGFSSIYYLLKKLEDKGLVISQLEQPAGRGPARKVYSITEQGRGVWAEQSLETLRDPVQQPTPFLLGLSVLPALDARISLQALEHNLSQLEKRRVQILKRLEEQRPLPPHVEAMFSYSLTLVEAEIGWLNTFIDQREQQDQKGGENGD